MRKIFILLVLTLQFVCSYSAIANMAPFDPNDPRFHGAEKKEEDPLPSAPDSGQKNKKEKQKQQKHKDKPT